MIKRFYKASIIIEVFLIIIIVLFLSFSNIPKNNNHVEIPYIYPNEFYLVSLLGCILLVISSLIAAFTGLFIGAKKKEEETTEATKKRNQKYLFWKFSFLANVILSFLMLCFTIYTYATVGSFMILYQPYLFKNYVFIISIGQLIISLISGAIFLSAGLLWLQNKAISVVIIVVGFLLFILPIGYLGYFKSFCYYDQINADYYNHFEEEANVIEGTAEGAIEEEHYDIGEEYEEGEEEYYFSFSDLWEDPYEDEENVKIAINDVADGLLFENRRNTLDRLRYYAESYVLNDSENNESSSIGFTYFKKIKDKISRDPENIRKAFETYKEILYSVISVKRYTKNDVDSFIDILLLSYYDIQSDENPNKTLDEIFKIMSKKDQYGFPDLYYSYGNIKPYISDKTEEKLNEYIFNDGSKIYESDKVWAYSFWARRNKEGTTQVVFNILNEVKKHYAE